MRKFTEASEYVMEVIREYGCDSGESSRLAQMRNILRKGYVAQTDPNFELACEAYRDIQLLEFAFDRLSGPVFEDALRKTLPRVVGDSPLPQNDQSNTPGRDAQTELYVAAICQAAGLNPRFEEPDVIADMDGRPYGLAVKRIKNMEQIEKRFCKGARQIQGSGVPGFVVLDITRAQNPENSRLAFPVNDDGFGVWWKHEHADMRKRYFPRFQEWRAGREVRGVILHYHEVCRSDSTGSWRLNGANDFVCLDPQNKRRRSEGHRFWDRYQGGLPNVVSRAD